jgi:hypothetical protein
MAEWLRRCDSEGETQLVVSCGELVVTLIAGILKAMIPSSS